MISVIGHNFCQDYDVSSEVVRTNIGVPQGPILGPLRILFYIYINGLVNTSDKFNFLMYADDTILIGSVEDFFCLVNPMSPQKML